MPTALQRATRDLALIQVYNELIEYDISLDLVGSSDVRLHFVTHMVVANRSSSVVDYRDVFDPVGRDNEFIAMAIDGIGIDPNDRDYIYGRGRQLFQRLQPGQRLDVRVEGASTFHAQDDELIGTYLPCERMIIRLAPPPSGLSVSFQSLLDGKIDVQQRVDGSRVFETKRGLLPFQGARLTWTVDTP